MNLVGKKVLITGGAGFIGSQIAEILTGEQVAEIVCLDNMERGNRSNLTIAASTGPLRLVEGDIRDHVLLDSLVADVDLVFHMAALRITQCAAEPEHAFEVMAKATFELLQMCVAHKIEKVVTASSASIYGLADQFPTSENAHPYSNRTLYGALKIFNEGLFRSFNDMYGLSYCAMRYFNVYGPRMDIHGKYTEVLIRWLDRISKGQSPIIFGDGLQTMDFIHVRDIAQANVAAAKSDVQDEVFNIAMGKETSLRELALTLLEVMGRPDLPIEYGPERSVNPVPRRLADTVKAERLLGFRANIELAEGLTDLLHWWQSETGRVET
jgi:UDP-glucose 4-epimerase